ncbi:MAG: NADH-quinone oxidoreductase subunit NuoE [Ignavibacteriales bacterium]|nr:NADH-quinone oxidoreductase subunit NuoE [Ignavibacteriales bacterium]
MSEAFFKKYERLDSSSLIPLLQDAQEEYGYLSEKMLQEIGDYVGLSLSRVYGVATFYNQFRLTPLGENLVSVCRGTACHVKNSANLLTAIENELGIEAGETTRDKKFTLETVSCIGACSIAPVISINGEFFGRLTPKDVPKILKPFKSAKKKEA